MELKSNLILLRKNIRANHRKIIDSIINKYKEDICVFCGTTKNLTKEHVIPKWAFGNRPDKYFTTYTNGLDQAYSKTSIPACSLCNTNILSSLENELVRKFNTINLDIEYFSNEDLTNVILWLEIIEFKFHVLNMRRKFIKSKTSGYIPYLMNFPILLLQDDASLTPSKVFSNLRKAHLKLAIKSKEKRYKALLIFKTKNKNFHFFHKTNHFIFLELADFGIGLFYFFNREFKTETKAHKEAMGIIKKVY